MQPAREDAPSHLCYGVRYAIGSDGQGFIQIPAVGDKDFKGNTRLSTAASKAAGSARRRAGKNWCGRASHEALTPAPYCGLPVPAAYLHAAAHRGGRFAVGISQALKSPGSALRDDSARVIIPYYN